MTNGGWIGDRLRGVVHRRLDAATDELRRKAAAFGLGVGLAAGAVVLLLFAVGFALSAGAAGLETALPKWASLLVVAGTLLVAAGGLGAAAATAVRKKKQDAGPEERLTK